MKIFTKKIFSLVTKITKLSFWLMHFAQLLEIVKTKFTLLKINTNNNKNIFKKYHKTFSGNSNKLIKLLKSTTHKYNLN